MLTDKEMEEFANEFKEFREWKKKIQKPRTWVSGGTCPDAGTSITYTYPNNVISKEFIENQPYNRLQKIIDSMERIAKGLVESGAMNYGLSLKSNIEELKKLIMRVE